MSQKVLIYPFEAKHFAFVSKLTDLNPGFKIMAVCSSVGSGLIDHDIAYSINWDPVGITVQRFSKELLSNCDTVIVLSNLNCDIKRDSFKLIHQAIKFQKNIICCMELSKRETKLIEKWKLESQYKSNLDFLMDRLKQEYTYMHRMFKHYTPRAPIVFIGGILEEANQEEVLLSLYAELKSQGYRISGLGNAPTLDLIGLNSYYYTLQEKSPIQTIERLNNYIANIERSECPELILIQLPGALMKFDNIIKADFGIYSYMFSLAASPDLLVCCTLCNALDDQFLASIETELERKLRVPSVVYCLSNVILNNSKSLEFKSPQYYRLSPREIEEELVKTEQELSRRVYSVKRKDDRKILSNRILSDLTPES